MLAHQQNSSEIGKEINVKIILYSINYKPELTGIGKYNGELCEWLVQQNHDVQVISGQPYYPDWKIFDGYSSLKYKRDKIEGVTITRCPLWVPKSVTFLSRIFHLLSFAISSFFALLSKITFKPDIIIAVQPSLLFSPAAILYSKLTGAKLLMHVQDFEFDAAKAIYDKSNSSFFKLTDRLERWAISKCNATSTISGKMLEKLQQKGAEPKDSFLFPNWVDISNIFPVDNKTIYRKDLQLGQHDFIALYSGNLGKKQGIECIIQAAEILVNEPIHFIICGQGAMEQELKTMSKHLNNLTWLPLQPLDKFNHLLGTANVHLLPQKKEIADLVLPSKLTGMLASGRPVIAAAETGTELYNFLEGNSVLVEPDNPQSLAKAISSLSKNTDLQHQLSKKSYRLACDNLNKETILQRFEQILLKIHHDDDFATFQ